MKLQMNCIYCIILENIWDLKCSSKNDHIVQIKSSLHGECNVCSHVLRVLKMDRVWSGFVGWCSEHCMSGSDTLETLHHSCQHTLPQTIATLTFSIRQAISFEDWHRSGYKNIHQRQVPAGNKWWEELYNLLNHMNTFVFTEITCKLSKFLISDLCNVLSFTYPV